MLTRRHLFVMATVAAAGGCAQAPSQRLASPEQAIEAVRVYTWSAGDAALEGAGAQRFVDTLRRNGIAVSGMVALRASPDLASLERAWIEASASKTPPASHALVLTQQRLDTFGDARYIRYEAVLWHAASRQLAWQSRLASLANSVARPPEQRAQALAGDALRGLARDGFITLPASGPLDVAGHEIPATRVPFQLL